MTDDEIVWPVPMGTTDLSDSLSLHIRHYGQGRQSDFDLQRPTS